MAGRHMGRGQAINLQDLHASPTQKLSIPNRFEFTQFTRAHSDPSSYRQGYAAPPVSPVQKQISKTMCEICGKKLATPASKKRHMETHSDYRRYGCTLCHKRFRQNAHLKKHMRLHTGERPFSCPHCEKRFTQKGTLTGHIRTKHTKECPVQCEQCGAKFPTRNHLRAHKNKCGVQFPKMPNGST
mmetsp:Transcript_13450/g.25475  ORF Transcript_13450/g.25475 Transcript_13450/m.25475 type:complete len:185 (+) Transcript_13450:1324-1878(+)